MSFINQHFLRLCRNGIAESVWRFRSPDLKGEDAGIGILHYITGIGRKPESVAAIPADKEFAVHPVMDRVLRDLQFPVAIFIQLFACPFRTDFPVGEIADQIEFCCVGSPFPESPPVFCTVQTVIGVADRHFFQRHSAAGQAIFHCGNGQSPLLQYRQERLQIRIGGKLHRIIVITHSAHLRLISGRASMNS